MSLKILLMILSTTECIYSQILYKDTENNVQSFLIEAQTSTLQTSLEKCEVSLSEKSLKKENINNAYMDILKLYGSKKFPDDRTISDWCKRHPSLIIADADNCHQYYNCSGEDYYLSSFAGTYGVWPARNKHECHYPELFSEETLKCENYTKVNCGKRYEPVWGCRYVRLQCKFSLCVACDARYPKCEGKADGLYPKDDGIVTNMFKICQNGRTVKLGSCSYDPIWLIEEFPYEGRCVHRYAIPKDKDVMGLLPSCEGVEDGNYPFEDRYCDAYYRYDGGIATPVKCLPNTLFNNVTRTCQEGKRCW
ncbi:uncharacterized protein LOC134252717 [Saccostrea cucullata]|uniref:uncharacterized protein LOC134252717 n=1 Tax=Saccostrea cuccullata TaxID=36930 RepID=UPI002ED03C67